MEVLFYQIVFLLDSVDGKIPSYGAYIVNEIQDG